MATVESINNEITQQISLLNDLRLQNADSSAVEEAKKSPEPDMHDFWNDIYYKGTEPPFMRGREREEIHYY